MSIITDISSDELLWYKDAIIYELHIKAFKDSTGNGIGDFEGLMQKLDYLHDLGVTAIWVLPFYPSPLKDDGYDIADYYSINPSYGNIDQFKKLLQEAHKRNLKVITELVINHTSDMHPWFQRARRAPKGSPERDYYVWTDNPEQYKGVRIIFQDFETSNWTWDPVAQQYFWHRFFHHQPDLNYDNPLVQEEVFKIIDYWCALGVDGFRLDAVPYLYEREGTNGENLPETHVYLKKLRTHVDEHFPGTVLLAEANMWPEDSASYFGDGDECHMNYHFPVMPRMFMSLQMEDRYPITDIFEQTPAIPYNCQWAIFLRNHDELTLEMVTDEERDYMYKAYAKDPKAKINLGIRHRLAPLMENNRRKIELMNVLLFSLAGTPVIYYGDEIGMGDNVYLGDRDGVRTPMQWSRDRNGGFSEGNPQRLYLPLILDTVYAYESLNVEEQSRNPSSLLWFMKNIINMRKRFKAFSRGSIEFSSLENPKILAFTRVYNNQVILVIVNLSRYAQPAEIDLSKYKGYVPIDVYSKNKFPIIKDAPYFFTLSPYACYWLELKQVVLKSEQKLPLTELKVSSVGDLLSANNKYQLENTILPSYIAHTSWFPGQKSDIKNINIIDCFTMPLQPYNALFLLIEVSYESGLPDTYQLPVTLLSENGNKQDHISPNAIICTAVIDKTSTFLVDALYLPSLQIALFAYIASQKTILLKGSEIVFKGDPTVTEHFDNNPNVKSKALNMEDNNTSVSFNNAFFLKIYRQVDRAINPDVELTHYLTHFQKFASVPDMIGCIEWRSNEQKTMVLAMLQPLVEYHGNGRSYMFERLNNFYERIVARQEHPEQKLPLSLTRPIDYETLADDMKEFIGGTVAEGAALIGTRTGEMHNALAADNEQSDFMPEEFSLHYQRSLFSGFQSLVRVAFHNLSKNLHQLPKGIVAEAIELLTKREEVLEFLKKIYAKKIDATRIRVHGNYQLRRIIFTGKNLAIIGFGGDPTRSYSERRIKRSPLRDVAGMIRSFYYAAYEGLIIDKKFRQEEIEKHKPFCEVWISYVSGYFLHAYLKTVKGQSFIPNDTHDFEVILQTYILEKALHSLNYETANRPGHIIVAIRLINSVLKK